MGNQQQGQPGQQGQQGQQDQHDQKDRERREQNPGEKKHGDQDRDGQQGGGHNPQR